MSDQRNSKRENQFKTEMPNIPGVTEAGRDTGRKFPVGYAVAGSLAIVAAIALGFWWMLRTKHAEPAARVIPQMEIASAEPARPLPPAAQNDGNQTIATVAEMAKPWSAKDFVYRNAASGAMTPALLVRLPMASAASAAGYWAFAMNAAYGNCKLEYLTDLKKLAAEYGYRAGKHPMIGNPCTQTVIDPLRMASLPGRVWVRGAIVQGTDLRPPFAIEVKIKGKNIVASRME